jgi:hypothetical protein
MVRFNNLMSRANGQWAGMSLQIDLAVCGSQISIDSICLRIGFKSVAKELEEFTIQSSAA